MEQVKTTVEKRPVDSKALESADLIEKSGIVAKPPLNQYVGSFVLHIYKEGINIDTHNFSFVTQFVGDVPEALAIEGAKVLKTDMLAKYGHVLKQRK